VLKSPDMPIGHRICALSLLVPLGGCPEPAPEPPPAPPEACDLATAVTPGVPLRSTLPASGWSCSEDDLNAGVVHALELTGPFGTSGPFVIAAAGAPHPPELAVVDPAVCDPAGCGPVEVGHILVDGQAALQVAGSPGGDYELVALPDAYCVPGPAPPPGTGVSEDWPVCPGQVVRVPVTVAPGRSVVAFVHWRDNADDPDDFAIAFAAGTDLVDPHRSGTLIGTAFAEAFLANDSDEPQEAELQVWLRGDGGSAGSEFGLRISEEDLCPDDGLPGGGPLPVGPVSGLRVCPGQPDRFASPSAPWSELTVGVRATSPVAVAVDGEVTAEVTEDTLVFRPATTGILDLEISGDSFYDLDVDQLCGADALEPSEPDQAWPLDPGPTVGLSLCDGEVDVYELESASWLALDLQVVHDAGEGEIEAVLLDQQGQAVSSDAVLADRRRVVAAGLPGPVRLELRQPVEAGLVPGNGYSLEIEAVCLSDSAEPDDIPQPRPSTPAVRTACADVDRIAVGQAPWLETNVLVTPLEGAEITATTQGSDGLVAVATEEPDGLRMSLPTGPVDATWVEIGLATESPALSGASYLVAVHGECRDDAGEPNEDADTATALSALVGDPLSICADDSDYVSIPLTAGERLDLAVPYDEALGDLGAALLIDGGIVARAANEAGGLRLRYEASQDATAVVAIELLRDRGGVPGVGYELVASSPSADACAPDSFDGAVGPLRDGETPGLRLCGDDEHLIAAQAGRAITAAATGASLALRDGSDQVVAQGVDSVSWTPSVTELYSLQVSGEAGLQYTVDLVGGEPPPCVADGFEPDGGLDSAELFGVGAVDRTLCIEDKDWAGIAAEPGEPIDVEVTWDDAAGPVVAELYDFAGRLLISDSGAGVARLTWEATYVGVHWVRVRPADPATFDGAPYTLDVLAAGSVGGCEDDVHEDNDSQTSAPALAAGPHFALVACPGDEDWYELVGPLGQTVEAEVIFHLNGGVVEASLHDSAGAILDVVDEPSGFERLSAEAGVDPLYLRVAWASGPNSGVQYDLGLAGIDSSKPECPDDAYEPNDRYETPVPLPLGDHELRLCRQQEDWFLLDSGTVRAGLSADPTEITLGLMLMDDQGRLVAASADGGSLQHVRASVDQGRLGVVYVQDNGREVGGAYALSVDVE